MEFQNKKSVTWPLANSYTIQKYAAERHAQHCYFITVTYYLLLLLLLIE